MVSNRLSYPWPYKKKLNIQGHVSKTYFLSSWLSDQSEQCVLYMSEQIQEGGIDKAATGGGFIVSAQLPWGLVHIVLGAAPSAAR